MLPDLPLLDYLPKGHLDSGLGREEGGEGDILRPEGFFQWMQGKERELSELQDSRGLGRICRTQSPAPEGQS